MSVRRCAARRSATRSSGCDFAIYSVLATYIADKFFPSGDDTVALLNTFAIFAAAFFMRPLGGLLLRAARRVDRPPAGAGDRDPVDVGLDVRHRSGAKLRRYRCGRPAVTSTSSLPARFFGRRRVRQRRVLAWPNMRRTSTAGLSSRSWCGRSSGASCWDRSRSPCCMRFSSESAMESYGWRIPFLLAGLLGAVGLYIRLRLRDTPEFEELRDEGEVSESPLKEALTTSWRPILQVRGWWSFTTSGFYTVFTFLPSYFTKTLGFTKMDAFVSITIASVVALVFIPPLGALSDRIGRKPLLIAGSVCFIAARLSTVPAAEFQLMATAIAGHAGLAAVEAVFVSASLAAGGRVVRYQGAFKCLLHRLQHIGRDLRWDCAVCRDLADRPHRQCARARVLRDRRGRHHARDRDDHARNRGASTPQVRHELVPHQAANDLRLRNVLHGNQSLGARQTQSIALTTRAAVEMHPASVESSTGWETCVLSSTRGSPSTTTRWTPTWLSGGYSQCGAAAAVSRVMCSMVITGTPSRTPSTANRTAAICPGSTVIILHSMRSVCTTARCADESRRVPRPAGRRDCAPDRPTSTR